MDEGLQQLLALAHRDSKVGSIPVVCYNGLTMGEKREQMLSQYPFWRGGAAGRTFGHWLAAFIDGEGHFMIEPKSVSPRMVIALRADDYEVLVYIRNMLGIGALQWAKARGTTNAAIQYRVQGRGDCMKLIRVLDLYPLRSRKRHQYKIWRDALRSLHPSYRGRLPHLTDAQRLVLREASVALKEARRYYPPPMKTTAELAKWKLNSSDVVGFATSGSTPGPKGKRGQPNAQSAGRGE